MSSELDGDKIVLAAETDELLSESMEEAELIRTTVEDIGFVRYSSTDEIVMAGLRRASGRKSAVYDGGSAIIGVDDGSLASIFRGDGCGLCLAPSCVAG